MGFNTKLCDVLRFHYLSVVYSKSDVSLTIFVFIDNDLKINEMFFYRPNKMEQVAERLSKAFHKNLVYLKRNLGKL